MIIVSYPDRMALVFKNKDDLLSILNVLQTYSEHMEDEEVAIIATANAEFDHYKLQKTATDLKTMFTLDKQKE